MIKIPQKQGKHFPYKIFVQLIKLLYLCRKLTAFVNGGDAQSFEYCLTGMPTNSVIACGNVGIALSPIATKLWKCLITKAIDVNNI